MKSNQSPNIGNPNHLMKSKRNHNSHNKLIWKTFSSKSSSAKKYRKNLKNHRYRKESHQDKKISPKSKRNLKSMRPQYLPWPKSRLWVLTISCRWKFPWIHHPPNKKGLENHHIPKLMLMHNKTQQPHKTKKCTNPCYNHPFPNRDLWLALQFLTI